MVAASSLGAYASLSRRELRLKYRAAVRAGPQRRSVRFISGREVVIDGLAAEACVKDLRERLITVEPPPVGYSYNFVDGNKVLSDCEMLHGVTLFHAAVVPSMLCLRTVIERRSKSRGVVLSWEDEYEITLQHLSADIIDEDGLLKLDTKINMDTDQPCCLGRLLSPDVECKSLPPGWWNMLQEQKGWEQIMASASDCNREALHRLLEKKPAQGWSVPPSLEDEQGDRSVSGHDIISAGCLIMLRARLSRDPEIADWPSYVKTPCTVS